MFERIRRLRDEAELNQEDVAHAINITQRSYSYYETGQNMVPPQVLMKLAFFYGTSMDYIVGLTDEMQPYNYNPSQTKGFIKFECENKPL